jgi:hypothetical protein
MEVVTGQTRTLSLFPTCLAFLSAWQVYVSIRTMYAPERASSLALWTERIAYYGQSGFHWSAVLNYAISFFQKYQNDGPEYWLSVDTEMTQNYLVKPLAALSRYPSAGGSNTSRKKAPIDPLPFGQQTCRNWNRGECNGFLASGQPCTRQHVCAICKGGHKSTQCTSTSRTAQN